MTLDTHNEVVDSVCDPDSFNQLFTPLDGLEPSDLHSTLCELAKSDHPTFVNDLMVHFDNAPLQEEVRFWILILHIKFNAWDCKKKKKKKKYIYIYNN